MRHLATLVHGMELFQQQQQGSDVPAAAKVSSVVSFAARTVLREHQRRLEDMGGMGMQGMGEDGGIMDLLNDEELVNKMGQCGVDLGEMMMKVMTSGLLDDSGMGGNMPESSENMLSNYGLPEGMETFDFLGLFGDDQEPECSSADETAIEAASMSLLTCTGFLDLMNLQDDQMMDLAQDLNDKCMPAVTSVMSMDPGAEPDMTIFNDCFNVILGDNPIGNFERDLYHHPDKYCDCLSQYGDALPACHLDMADSMPFSGSGLKNIICLMGIACDAIEGFCSDQIEGMSQCLPPKGNYDCAQVATGCLEAGVIPVEVPPFSLLTAGALPTVCKKVYDRDYDEDKGDIMGRYDAFNSKCTEETSSSASSNDSSSSEDSSSEDSSEEDLSSFADTFSTSSTSISSLPSTSSSEPSVSTSSKMSKMFIFGLVVGVMAIIALVMKKNSAVALVTPPRRDFSTVKTDDDETVLVEGYLETEMT